MRVFLVGLILSTLIVSVATPFTAAATPRDDWVKALSKAGIRSTGQPALPGKGPLCLCLSGAGVESDLGVVQYFYSVGQIRLTCTIPKFSGDDISQEDACSDWVIIPRKS